VTGIDHLVFVVLHLQMAIQPIFPFRLPLSECLQQTRPVRAEGAHPSTAGLPTDGNNGNRFSAATG
jgi:hypothetical protein